MAAAEQVEGGRAGTVGAETGAAKGRGGLLREGRGGQLRHAAGGCAATRANP